MDKPRIAHVVNPFVAPEGSELSSAQPITFETMRRARDTARTIEVELLAVAFPDELATIPDGFRGLRPLDRSVLDLGDFDHPRRLPLLRDILDRMFEATDAELLVYTNVDIALMPHFYTSIQTLYMAGAEAFVVNTRTIGQHYRDVAQIDLMITEVGSAHPGHDCFVFSRSHYERYDVGDVCLGVYGVGRALLFELIAHTPSFMEFNDRHLTFHIGHLGPHPAWGPAEIEIPPYTRHNFQENRYQVERLARNGMLREHPLVRRGLEQLNRRFESWKLPLLPQDLLDRSLSDVPQAPSYSVRFVCQGGELEIKGLLLALSLRKHLADVEIICCVPKRSLGFAHIKEGTAAEFKRLGVKFAKIDNPFGRSYPIGNKLATLAIPTEADYKIFLDSDILCLGDYLSVLKPELSFAAVPADQNTFPGTEEDWRCIYQTAGLELPKERIESTVSGERMLPYFNAGVIVVDSTLPFAETWTDLAIAIEAMPGTLEKRPHLDQFALPTAVKKLGIDYTLLESTLNFPAHIRPVEDDALLIHYHWPSIIEREPALRNEIQALAAKSPHLTTLIRTNERWAPLLHRSKLPVVKERETSTVPCSRNLVITGIPRSGTSYLCQILHRFSDCVVINEPAEVFRPLLNQKRPYGLGVMYRRFRQRIVDEEAINNKWTDGDVISDTVVRDQRVAYTPKVSRNDFVLATKNTLAYLARLDAVRQVLDGAEVVACVRNPWDTIASWKSSFPHLQNADVVTPPVVGLKSKFLTQSQRNELQAIASMHGLARRRAAYWSYLAGHVVANAGEITIIRYEDLVLSPEAVGAAILSTCFGADPGRAQVPAGKKSDKLDLLDAHDLKAIEEFCLEAARRLKVALPPNGLRQAE